MEAQYSEKNPSFRMNTRLDGNLSVVPHETQPEFFGDGSLMVDEEIYCDYFSAATPGANVLLKDALVQTRQYQKPVLPLMNQTQLYPDAEYDGRFVMVKDDGQLIDLNPLQQRGDTMIFDQLKQTTSRVPLGLPGQLYTVNPLLSVGSGVAWKSPTFQAHNIQKHEPTSLELRYVALSLSSDLELLDPVTEVAFDMIERQDRDVFEQLSGLSGPSGISLLQNGVYEARCQINVKSIGETAATLQVDGQVISCRGFGNGPLTIQRVFDITNAPKTIEVKVTGNGTALAGSTLDITKLTDNVPSFSSVLSGSEIISLPASIPWEILQENTSTGVSLDNGTFTVSRAGRYHVSGTVALQNGVVDVAIVKNAVATPITTGQLSVPFDSVLELVENDTFAVKGTGSGQLDSANCYISVTFLDESVACLLSSGEMELVSTEFLTVTSAFLSEGGTYLVSSLVEFQNTDSSDGTYGVHLIIDEREVENSLFVAHVVADEKRTLTGFSMLYVPPNTLISVSAVSVQGSGALCKIQSVFKKYETTLTSFHGYSDFGRYYRSVTSNDRFSTTSTSFRPYLTLKSGPVPTGTYLLNVLIDYSMTRPGSSMEIVVRNGSDILDSYSETPVITVNPTRICCSRAIDLSKGQHIISVSVRTTDKTRAVVVTVGALGLYLLKPLNQ